MIVSAGNANKVKLTQAYSAITADPSGIETTL